ncbi:cytochrome P450- family 5- subfamily A [Apiospora hydei]|uniref:Cytochrome P450- family 5- subfamily A n=1 Tax=Apiospora hydei TaxID=1337664 RepID=A0ABR1XDY8_9PEZI
MDHRAVLARPRAWFLPLCRLLPEPLCLFTRVITMDWPKEDGCELHDRFGPAFWVISPGTIQLMCADPVANEEIMTRYKAWTKPPEHVGKYSLTPYTTPEMEY